MSKETKIIAAFPAMGKTTFTAKCEITGRYKCADSDSSTFSWTTDYEGKRIRNPHFAEEYIDHIHGLYNCGEYDYIFVSTHKDIIAALIKEKFNFIVLYPRLEDKDIIIQRCIDRGSPESLVKIIRDNYENFIDDIMTAAVDEKTGLKFLPIESKHFVEDYIELDALGFDCVPSVTHTAEEIENMKFSCSNYGEQ